MKYMLLIFSTILLRCCWGPTDFQLKLLQQNDNTILKELHGTYNINTLKGDDVSVFKLQINFNDSTKEVSVFSGCNRFSGSYTLNNNALSFGNLASTRMLCPKDKNEIESTLLSTFKKADLVLFENSGFSLYNKKKLLLSTSKIVEEKIINFEYITSSRNSFKRIKINKHQLFLSKKRGGKLLTLEFDPKQRETLIRLSDAIEIENISSLESPSKKFQFDGAPLARLKITSNGKTFESVPFDHGNPPQEIMALIKDILSIAENIE